MKRRIFLKKNSTLDSLNHQTQKLFEKQNAH